MKLVNGNKVVFRTFLISSIAALWGVLGASQAFAKDAKAYTGITQKIFDCMKKKENNTQKRTIGKGWADYTEKSAANGSVTGEVHLKTKGIPLAPGTPASLTYIFSPASKKITYTIAKKDWRVRLVQIWDGFTGTIQKCQSK